jgi:hypothetical protein
MFYNARYYDAYLNRWLQPDSIIPDPYNPLDFDRYSYVRNNPINFNDPSGHAESCFECGGTSIEDTLNYFTKYGRHGDIFNEYYATIYFAEEEYANAMSDGVLDENEITKLDAYDKSIENTYNQGLILAKQDNLTPSMFENITTGYVIKGINQGAKLDNSIMMVTLGTGVIILFGHGARHLAGLAVSPETIESLILEDVNGIIASSSRFPGSFFGRIVIDGITIEYRAYPVNGNTINVGTYYPIKTEK